MNALLPTDIRVEKIWKVPFSFHARFKAKKKLYRYRILNRPIQDPFRTNMVWHFFKKLDVSRMRRASRYFVGRHDFSAVAVNPGYERETMVRHVYRCTVLKRKDEIHIEIEADGFLYKMARTMVGTLVEIGEGKRSPESVASLLSSKDRKYAGKTAPPQGLFLVKIDYPSGIKFLE
jgi:tRNA pseudouridine38-40 synthase